VGCDELEPVIEAIADGTLTPSPEQDAHLAACPGCRARLERARQIEQWLAHRETPQPSPSFTAAVMARVSQEQWRAERIVDLGFNLAIAAGVLVILAGGFGAAWSVGLFTITLDAGALLQMFSAEVEGRVINQVQTVIVAALLLTSALGLWWWAEAATD
jgi:anti-sigma factor RsiW